MRVNIPVPDPISTIFAGREVGSRENISESAGEGYEGRARSYRPEAPDAENAELASGWTIDAVPVACDVAIVEDILPKRWPDEWRGARLFVRFKVRMENPRD